jgi:predicted phosphodiesterase
MSELDEMLENSDASTTIRRLQRQLSAEKNKTSAIEKAIEEALTDNAKAMRVAPVKAPAKHVRKGKREEIAVPWLSDLQGGKLTPTYDSEVMEQRVNIYAHKALELIDLQRNAAEINHIRSWWLGDMVEGEDIFPGQAYLIDSSTYEQVFTVAESLIQTVRLWLTEVQRVDVEAVIGNHGRVGRKGQMSTPTNFDRMVYRVVQIALQEEPRFSIKFAEPAMRSGEGGWYWVSEIGGLRTLLVHGHQFRGTLGVPWYGIRKKVLGWKAMGTNPKMGFPDFDDVAFGHHHQQVTWVINGIGVRGNGTTESWNDFAAEQLAGMGRPSQRLMFVSPSKGKVTAEYPDVWLDEGEDLPEVPWQTLHDALPDEE